MNKPTRGERNNNPGNIDRNTTQWQGMSADQCGDKRFVVFDSPVYGIRALAKTLLTYQRKHGLRTVTAIVDRWAPPVENDTGAYVRQVARALKVAATQAINLSQRETLTALVAAIIAHENGRCIYDDALIEKAVDLALDGA